MTNKSTVLDAELQRILDIASEMAPIPNELHTQMQQNQSTWPWQVPQLPTYTADHIPTQRHIEG